MPIAKTFACAVLTVACGGALGQDVAPLKPRRIVPPPKPFSMVQTEVRTDTLAGGLTFTHTRMVTTIRDSEWRMRTERTPENDSNRVSDGERTKQYYRKPFVTVSVFNAPERESLSWSTQSGAAHEVRVIHMHDAVSRPREHVDPTERANTLVAQMERVNLGTKVLQGITVEGQRTTTTFPANYSGNNLPYVTSQETWTARDFGGITIESTSEMPVGKTVLTLTSFTPGEPDEALFKAPEGYTVRDISQ